ncbi:MAG: FKBP-type peptidyl-prolyl cis-trans isomerase [Candidatus Lokiarchaeota archaeon]|nr:FKBP-type peptidyl-prolyl cis-trans isomerase [Candidatus Lokiarchaeota archaeon]
MTPTLEDVKGLGTKITTIKEAGIDSVEKLANASVDDLSNLKGIGEATAEKIINSAKELLDSENISDESETKTSKDTETDKKLQEELKKLEEKRKKLAGKKVEKGDFVLVNTTAKTQKGKIFKVSSEEDAKKAGIYDEQDARQGYYTPDFVIVGKPGFLNEGLTETIETMNFFEKKSVRIPPNKAFGKREPSKIERIGIAKFKKMNEGKMPEIGKEFVKKSTGQRGTITNIVQGKVIVDYNHPLAGQNVDYNLEIIDRIEGFEEKIEYFLINKGIPKDNVKDFNFKYNKDDKSVEFTIPKMFLFQNLTYMKFGIAMDLQTHMSEEINDVKFVEIFEKMPVQTTPMDSVAQKVDEFNKEIENKE